LNVRSMAILALAFIAMLILHVDNLNTNLTERVAALDAKMDNVARGHIEASVATRDPILGAVFEPLIQGMASNAEFLKHHELVFDYGSSSFPLYYKRVLDAFPRHEFFAVSLPWARHVWGDGETIFEAMKQFTQDGGKIHRVFIVSSVTSLSEEEKQIVNKHLASGVDVWLVKRADIGSDDQRFVLVESGGSFGWEASIGIGDRVTSVRASTDKGETQKWIDVFQHLRHAAKPVKTPFVLSRSSIS
jgi:hypothetical protein